MNEKNLHPVRNRQEAQAKGKRGGVASGKARNERKALKEQLLLLLSEGDTQNNLCLSLIEKAMKGDTRAFEVIRDTIGEKPADKTQNTDTVLVAPTPEVDIEQIKRLNALLRE